MWRPSGSPGMMSHLGMGIFLTLLGVFMTLDTLHVMDLSVALRFWPIGFHVLGLTILSRRSDSQGRFWGIAWLVVGTWLLVNSLGLARIGFWELVWPLILLVVGVRLIMRARSGEPSSTTPADVASAVGDALGNVASRFSAGDGHRPNLVAVMSETKSAVAQPFAGASMTSVMGGSHLDLRQAAIAPGTTPIIDVFSLMGGLEIVVPSGWIVTLDVVSILAGTEDKRLPPIVPPPPEGVPHVIVRGITIMSGLTVKN
jgi:predicted membrane protein